MPPQAVRPLALVAILGGAVFVVLGYVQLTSPEQADPFSRTSDYLIEALRALALLLTLAGFVALHLLQASGYGGPRGWTGFRAAVVGQGAILASAVASLAAGAPALGASPFWEPSCCSLRSRCSASRPTEWRSCRIGAPIWWLLLPWSSLEKSGWSRSG